MIAEIVGGFLSDSLAILTDAAHMLSDVAGFVISIFAIWIGQKSPTQKNSWGYHRAEVLGALSSIIIIWGMVIWLVKEAIERVMNRDHFKIDAEIMLITSLISLACNIFSLVALDHLPCCQKKGQESILHKLNSVYMPHGGCSHDHGPGGHDHSHSHGHSHEGGKCSGHDHNHNH